MCSDGNLNCVQGDPIYSYYKVMAILTCDMAIQSSWGSRGWSCTYLMESSFL